MLPDPPPPARTRWTASGPFARSTYPCGLSSPLTRHRMMGSLAHRVRRATLSGLGTRSGWVLLASLTASCSAASCQGSQGTTPGSSVTMQAGRGRETLDDHFAWEDSLIFTDSAASAAIHAYFDPAGGFVVADGGQAQLRVYTDEARLLWAAGRSGGGPGAFQQLRAAVRTSSREVVALDNSGRLSTFDPAGKLLRTTSTGLDPAYNLWLLDDSTVLLSGRREDDERTRLLHVWDLRRNQVRTSFFQTPPHDPALDFGYEYSGWANAALLGRDTLGVVFPLSDTLYLYGTDGRELEKFALPLDHYRRLREPGPADETPEAEIRWRNSYTRISQVFRAPGRSVYVQYFNVDGLEPVWGLARFSLERSRLRKMFEVPEAHRLLGVSPRDSRHYFLRADLMESTVWSIGRLSH